MIQGIGEGIANAFKFLLFVIVCLLFVVGLVSVRSCTSDEHQDDIQIDLRTLRLEAIERGYATWHVVDPETGKTEFRWVEPAKEEKPNDD